MARAAAALLLVGVLAGGGVTAAQAQPNCDQTPLPPACGPRPKPPVPTAKPLESVRFTPDFRSETTFHVGAVLAAGNPLLALPDGAATSYGMTISCSNGYFYAGHLHRAGRGLGLDAPTVSPGLAPGTCYATTWDQATFGVNHSTLRAPITVAGAGGVHWLIDFDHV